MDSHLFVEILLFKFWKVWKPQGAGHPGIDSNIRLVFSFERYHICGPIILIFFKEHSPLLFKLAQLACGIDKYAKDFLRDRSAGDSPVLPGLLNRFTLARTRVSTSALWNELQANEPFYLCFSLLSYNATRRRMVHRRTWTHDSQWHLSCHWATNAPIVWIFLLLILI